MRLSLEYIAAFLDCDGTVIISKADRSKKGHCPDYSPRIPFYSQNIAVLQDIAETVGGKITSAGGKLTCYTLYLSGSESIKTLKQILPFLRIKAEQAKTLIAFQEFKHRYVQVGRKGPMGGGNLHMPQSEIDAREAFHLKVKALNKVDSSTFKRVSAEARRINRVNSVKLSLGETIPSQAVEGEGSTEGVTTIPVSPNNNLVHESPSRKVRDSLSSVISQTVQ